MEIDPSEAFVRAYRSQDFAVTELPASSHILTAARGDAHYVAIPAFVSRLFRHSSFHVRTDRIRRPEDLADKQVGVTEYPQTAGLWVRGTLVAWAPACYLRGAPDVGRLSPDFHASRRITSAVPVSSRSCI